MSLFRKNLKFTNQGAIPTEDSFYFRITGKNLYYTETGSDMQVLGAISITNIQSTGPSELEDDCFNVQNSEDDEWHLCANTYSEREKWYNAINKAIGNDSSATVASSQVIIEEVEHVEQPMIIINTPSPYCNEDWSFKNYGKNWECKCTEGKQQSPIDLPRRKTALPTQGAALFDYFKVSKANAKFVWEDGMVKIKGTFGTLTDVDMAEYEAYEIRIHTPSEHRIRGKQYDMEIQIVHKPLTQGDMAKKAILSVMFEKRYGSSNKFFDSIDYLNLPDKYNPEVVLDTDVDINLLLTDEAGLTLPGAFNYYFYHGSMSSPPCDEHVQWFVVADVLPLGSTVLDMFRDTINVKLKLQRGDDMEILNAQSPMLDGNYRLTQSLNDRNVYFYDRTRSEFWEDIKPSRKPSGHYEKVQTKVYKYLKVGGERPSGIPNSFMVTDEEALAQKMENCEQ